MLSFFHFFIHFFSFSFRVCLFFVSFSPIVLHFTSKFSSSHYRLSCKSLGSNSLFPYFFKTVLWQFFVITFLISFKLLVHPKSFRYVFFNNIHPCTFNILCFLLIFSFFWSILNFVSLLNNIFHIAIIYFFLFKIILYKVRVKL